MFGDILSDEASELCGSLGLGGAVNAGDGVCVAQAQHGSAPDIAGQGVANPVSLVRSAGHAARLARQALRTARARSVAARLAEDVVAATVADPATRTRDLGGSLDTARAHRRPRPAASPSARPGGPPCLTSPPPTSPPPPSLLVRPGSVEPFDRGNGVVTIPYVGKWNCATNRVTTGQTQFAARHRPAPAQPQRRGVGARPRGRGGRRDRRRALRPRRRARRRGCRRACRTASYNRGDGPMRIYWVYGGRDVTRTITATGETFEHLSERTAAG